MQGRLTLHVRRLVHISQVSSVFLKSQCQCSCNDALTKILIPCRYENVLCSVGDIFHCVGFNNNRFINKLKYPVLSGCLLLFMLYFTRLRVCEISLFDLRSASAPYQCAVAVIQSELFINRCDVIHIDDIAPVASEKA